VVPPEPRFCEPGRAAEWEDLGLVRPREGPCCSITAPVDDLELSPDLNIGGIPRLAMTDEGVLAVWSEPDHRASATLIGSDDVSRFGIPEHGNLLAASCGARVLLASGGSFWSGTRDVPPVTPWRRVPGSPDLMSVSDVGHSIDGRHWVASARLPDRAPAVFSISGSNETQLLRVAPSRGAIAGPHLAMTSWGFYVAWRQEGTTWVAPYRIDEVSGIVAMSDPWSLPFSIDEVSLDFDAIAYRDNLVLAWATGMVARFAILDVSARSVLVPPVELSLDGGIFGIRGSSHDESGVIGFCLGRVPVPRTADGDDGVFFAAVRGDGIVLGTPIPLARDIDVVGACDLLWAGDAFVVAWWEAGIREHWVRHTSVVPIP